MVLVFRSGVATESHKGWSAAAPDQVLCLSLPLSPDNTFHVALEVGHQHTLVQLHHFCLVIMQAHEHRALGATVTKKGTRKPSPSHLTFSRINTTAKLPCISGQQHRIPLFDAGLHNLLGCWQKKLRQAQRQGPRAAQWNPGKENRQYSLVGFLGTGAGGLLLLCPGEAGVADVVVFGAVWVLLDPGLRAGAEAGLAGEVRFSAVFTSAVDYR